MDDVSDMAGHKHSATVLYGETTGCVQKKRTRSFDGPHPVRYTPMINFTRTPMKT